MRAEMEAASPLSSATNRPTGPVRAGSSTAQTVPPEGPLTGRSSSLAAVETPSMSELGQRAKAASRQLATASTALSSNVAIAGVLREGLAKAGLPADALVLIEDTSHEAAVEFMRLRDAIDCLIPRGGPSLIQAVLENATVPYVIDGDGNCHVYVDEAADLEEALEIVVNAKTQRPSVCNAAESLVVHESVADAFLPSAVRALEGVELVGDELSRQIAPSIGPATEDDFGREFLAMKMSVAVVPSLDAAIE